MRNLPDVGRLCFFVLDTPPSQGGFLMTMKYAENILELIGNTPLVKVNKITEGLKPTILLKLEYLNPGGSSKDRIAIAMIEDAEKKGLLQPGGTIIEPTSGNTGVGIAMAAAIKGYKVIFTMTDKVSKEKELILRAYGAEIIRRPADLPHNHPDDYYHTAERLAKEIPNAFFPDQYTNPENPNAHYRTTGPEIWKDTKGKITHFVVGLGTGGTVTGTGRYLKEQNKQIKIIGVDTEGSVYHSRFYKTPDKPGADKIEGIGHTYIPGNLDLSLVDDIVVVSDKEAFITARKVVRKEGILIGGSSGATVAAALKVAKSLTKDDVVVVLLPDSGKSYISKMFNDEWMKENNLL